MANDPDLKSDIKICNVDNYLYDKAEVWVGSPPYSNSGKQFLNLNKGERVPLQKTLIIPIKAVVKLTEEPAYNIPHKVLIDNLNINAIGIDLGMTRCCVAVRRANGFELVAIDNSKRQLPSYISFKENKPICGKLVINNLHLYANSTVFDIKRIIGKNFDDIEINSLWPFEVIKSDNNEKSMILVQGYDGSIVEKGPEEVAAILLKHIKQKVEEFQGKEMDEVVITIPAAFDVDQKIATHVAAELAGFKTVHLLQEPIAASIAYFVDRPIPPNFNMLLFDLGGGTLDLCIFKVEKNNLKIIAVDGDSHLGGRDFDVMFLDVSDFDPKIEEFLTITRQEFEKMAEPILNRIQEILKKTFSKTNIYASDINKVLLVGGGCRMPMVKSLIYDTFTKAEHFCDKNPDEMVAIGAAYYSSFIMSKNDSTACNIM
uniref:Heat shock protein 70 n=1 Tax=Panagrolaimus davidi TaxID=227884 RepID=A0A914PUF8_9BILA